MTGEWPSVPLKQVCKEIYRYPSFYGMEKYDKGVPVVRGEHLLSNGTISTDWSDYWFVTEEYAEQFPKTRLKLHDIVMSVRGSIGIFSKVGADHVGAQISPNLIRISPNPDLIEPTYLYYALRGSAAGQFIISTSSSSAVPAIRGADIKLAEIPLPPRKEQRTIAHILGTLDAKIELNRRMNETLEQMARALFKAWFVDFEPVHAKCRGEPPCSPLKGQAQGPAPTAWQWPQHILDLFPNRFVDSELGKIPEGWNVCALGNAIEVNPSRSLQKGDIAPYLDMANMPINGHIPYEITNRPFSSGTRFINGDTLLARITPCLENGKTAFVDFLKEGEVGWGSTEFIVLRPKPPLPAEFGYCLARDPQFRDFAIQSMTGTSGRQRVPPEALSHYKIVTPDEAVAKEFGKIVQPMFSRASKSDKESRALTALRDSLLPKLIRGEIRVKDAERFLKERGL